MLLPLTLAALLGAAAAATPGAVPAASVDASSPVASKVEGEKQRLRCKSYRPTGTRFDKRVCFTAEEWERRRQEAREAVRDIQNRPQICIDGPLTRTCSDPGG